MTNITSCTCLYRRNIQDDYSSNNFGQQESRDGYSAQGEYFVNLPDGRVQKVMTVSLMRSHTVPCSKADRVVVSLCLC